MNATTIVAYAYEAAFHCVECAAERYALHDLADDGALDLDENRIPIAALDCEGNEVTPVFANQAEEDDCCDDCFTKLL